MDDAPENRPDDQAARPEEDAGSELAGAGGSADELDAVDLFAFRRAAAKVREFPQTPGVYLMKDVRGTVLYVGKASVLPNRLRTYFGSPSSQPSKTRRMMGHVHDFEYIVTDTEAEALILENTLIKRYKPRYNARLKDDKTYPYLKIDLKEDFPRVYITRRVAKDGSRYFGPFATAGTVRKTMDLVKRLFPYRSCTKTITGADPRPWQRMFWLLA